MKKSAQRDRQLRKLELKHVLERRRLDQALNTKEFALAAGISYSAARNWFRKPGFPLIFNTVFWSDFVEWRRTITGLAALSATPPPAAPTEPARETRADRWRKLSPRAEQLLAECAGPGPTYGYPSRAEYLASLPPKARRILEEI